MPLYPLATLQAQVERFAGRPAVIDPRLLLPDCARPDFAFAAAGRSVRVHCAAPEWIVYVNVGDSVTPAIAEVAARLPEAAPAVAPDSTAATAGRSAPMIRRGDRVMVETGGDGFVVAMEAVAENDSRDGRVALRSAGGGRRLAGILMPDGRVTLAGLNTVVNGR